MQFMYVCMYADDVQIVWFLAPTVALCMQQHAEIASQIPAAKTRILTGLDKVDFWTEQGIWDAVLQDIQIVVSTHAVLADALTHGFVRIPATAAIVVSGGCGNGKSLLTSSMPAIMMTANTICNAMGTRHCAEIPLIQ